MSISDHDLILQLEKRIQDLEASLHKAHNNVKWDNEMTNVGTLTFDKNAYEGTFYKTEANKGTLAMLMENGGSSKPGTMKIGVKLEENKKEILTLARMHKTEDHDFYIKEATFKPSPSVSYGVIRTPKGYDQNPDPNLGYPGCSSPIISINCNKGDKWIEPDANLLERSHSPKPRGL